MLIHHRIRFVQNHLHLIQGLCHLQNALWFSQICCPYTYFLVFKSGIVLMSWNY